MDIVKTIRDNRLIYYTIDKLSKSLAKILSVKTEDVKNDIESLIEDGTLFLEDDKITISEDRGYLKARISLNRKGYGFAKVENYDDFFIPSFAISGAFDGDDCLVEITNTHGDKDVEARVVKILKRNTKFVVGTFVQGKSKNVVYPDDERLPQIRIFKDDCGKARNNDKVWVELFIESMDEGTLRGKINEILGQANTPKAEQLSIIRQYNLVAEFPEKVLSNAAAISQTVNKKDFKDRTDFTGQRVITIDGEDARDFDDAIAIEKSKEGYTLFVHIADVSNYVVENSALDAEAYARGTSVYFPNMVIPMLPKELSNGICSLSEGVERLTLSVAIKLDKDFNVLSSEIKEGIIKSCHRMTYTEITQILADDEMLKEKYADVYEDIMLYRDISNKLKRDRLSRGEIRMNLPEPFILENNKGEIVSIEKRMPDEAHEIIESLMILTNECVAKTFCDMKIPFVYRVHEKPDEEKAGRLAILLKNMGISNEIEVLGDQPMTYQKVINKITGKPYEQTITKLILRSMMKAKYSPSCMGHFGLASEFYCHFTSPIRRYPDLLIHRIIKDYLHKVPRDELKTKYLPIVEKASEQSSTTEKNADAVEREVDDYKKCVYMSKFLGEKFEGTISGVQEFGIFVELENGIEGLVKLDSLPSDTYEYDDTSLTLNGEYHHYKLGDKVEIIVASANTHLRQIDFELVGVETTLGNHVVRKSKEKSKSTKKSKTKRNTNRSKQTKRKKRK